MCRLFGFRSVLESGVHQSLMDAENALAIQSKKNPDGWGVCYYTEQTPHIIKAQTQALECNIFKHVSGVVNSQTVLAHIRAATQGEKNILNTHPFQFGQWTFAHNGNIKDFDQYRNKILLEIDPTLKRYILGNSDSEVIFFYILSWLKRDKVFKQTDFLRLKKSCLNAIDSLQKIIGPYQESKGDNTLTYLSFILTNGSTMLAFQGGQPLYYSTHKKQCPERDYCSFYNHSCENSVKSGKNTQVNHLIFSSEPLQGMNIWTEMLSGQLIGVDDSMNLFLP